jgi:8-oxo-dGTP pyrophosphatase MutT (NUDIX family)
MSAAPDDLTQRVHRAVRPIDDPPCEPGWNHVEIDDLLGSAPRRRAAVLVALVERASGPAVLFTQRTQDLAQHAGQVSFPGGGIDSGDADAVAAALRETHEEVGIEAALLRPFGFLDNFDTISGYCVTPVVAQLDPGYRANPNPREVAAAFETPLAYFLDPANLRRRRIDWRGRSREIIEFEYQNRMIWGATAAMMLNLVRRLDAVA